jgi:hypothetical protein
VAGKVRNTQETVTEILEEKEDSPIYKQIQETVDSMPESLKNSLYILAQRAEKEGGDTQKQLQQFQLEIETWFDRSMQRASGVYKRNSRGVAILLGAIAVANADTINIINRLSKDSILRSTVNLYSSWWQKTLKLN